MASSTTRRSSATPLVTALICSKWALVVLVMMRASVVLPEELVQGAGAHPHGQGLLARRLVAAAGLE